MIIFKTLLIVIIFLLSSLFHPAHALVSNDRYEHRIKYQINQVKREFGRQELVHQNCPNRFSEAWARHLRDTEEFYHQDIYEIIRRCESGGAGEVLARGDMIPHQAVKMWMESPEHRKVILNGHYRNISVGVRKVSQGRVVVVNFTY